MGVLAYILLQGKPPFSGWEIPGLRNFRAVAFVCELFVAVVVIGRDDGGGPTVFHPLLCWPQVEMTGRP